MSETTTPLEAETRFETTAFDHFGRSWTVPTKRHLSHIKAMTDALRTGVVDYNVLTAEVMLGPAQFLDLLAVDPDEEQLNAFVSQIAKAMGLGNSGNSAPSSTSS